MTNGCILISPIGLYWSYLNNEKMAENISAIFRYPIRTIGTNSNYYCSLQHSPHYRAD